MKNAFLVPVGSLEKGDVVRLTTGPTKHIHSQHEDLSNKGLLSVFDGLVNYIENVKGIDTLLGILTKGGELEEYKVPPNVAVTMLQRRSSVFRQAAFHNYFASKLQFFIDLLVGKKIEISNGYFEKNGSKLWFSVKEEDYSIYYKQSSFTLREYPDKEKERVVIRTSSISELCDALDKLGEDK